MADPLEGLAEDRGVERLHAVLLDELRRRGHPRAEPLSVGELYHDLVPYAAVRSRLGFELAADYDDALLRLLAGVGGYLRLESDEVRDALRRELEAPYPDVTRYRSFADALVWVAPEAGAAPSAEPREHATIRPPRAAGRAPIRLHREASGAGASPDPDRVDAASTRQPATCPFCGDPLPEGRHARFCPFCGGDQRLRPCPYCEAVLERGWRYCIRCGHGVGDPV